MHKLIQIKLEMLVTLELWHLRNYALTLHPERN